MPPQGDLIQLSPSCNGRYINPKGGSSRPRCQPFLQKLQHWTNRAVNWVNCTSQTPRFKDAPLGRVQLPSSRVSGTGYGFLNFGRQTINHSPWPCMGHTHNFQSSSWGWQILPWSWDSKSRLIGISQGGRYKRGVSSENQVWEGQNGAMRRRRAPLTFTLHSTAGISFIGGNAYRLTFGHGWANASMPRVVGKLGTKGEDGAQACPGCATVNLLGGLCGTQPPYCPSWLWYDTPRERGENTSKLGRQPWVPGSLYAKRGTLPSTPRSLVCLRRPRPSLSLMRPSWSYGDGGSHPFSPRSGERRGSRHIKRCQQQLRDTLIRRVAGTVGCNLSSFIHQRNGLMWSSPRGNTVEAAAMRPNSLWQVPTETWWPSLKRARHAVRTGIRAGAKRACIWTESKRTPRNTVRWDGRSTLFLAFILRPREWMWPRTISLWRLTSSLEWARMSQSSR